MATKRAQPPVAAPEDTDEAFEASAKAPAAKAPKAKRAAPAPDPVIDNDTGEAPAKKGRTVRGDRNHLATSIDAILRSAEGQVSVRDIATQITYTDGSHPSSGAVAACLKRWSEQGYITVVDKPLAFKSYPAAHKKGTLDAFLSKQRETRLAERRAARQAASA